MLVCAAALAFAHVAVPAAVSLMLFALGAGARAREGLCCGDARSSLVIGGSKWSKGRITHYVTIFSLQNPGFSYDCNTITRKNKH
eukprot:1162120-Pelagomonas_calceolata.AAC.4